MLGEPSHNVVFLDERTEQVHTGQDTLLVLEAGNYGTIVVGVHLVPALVADVRQIVHQLLHRVLVLIVMQRGLVDQILDPTRDFLEVGVLARSHDHRVLVDSLEAGHVLVF